ncbi:hypothetical protein SDC9_170819 [bioreactor metagenome]|uniref:Uncharacterized protein n=1 Tax=bioreactor metagenome TaxID=1076179 RepID=A0A645G942_9ZZZZ
MFDAVAQPLGIGCVDEDLHHLRALLEDVICASSDDDARPPFGEVENDPALSGEDRVLEGDRAGAEGFTHAEERRTRALLGLADRRDGKPHFLGGELYDVAVVVVDAEAFTHGACDGTPQAAELTSECDDEP